MILASLISSSFFIMFFMSDALMALAGLCGCVFLWFLHGSLRTQPGYSFLENLAPAVLGIWCVPLMIVSVLPFGLYVVLAANRMTLK